MRYYDQLLIKVSSNTGNLNEFIITIDFFFFKLIEAESEKLNMIKMVGMIFENRFWNLKLSKKWQKEIARIDKAFFRQNFE